MSLTQLLSDIGAGVGIVSITASLPSWPASASRCCWPFRCSSWCMGRCRSKRCCTGSPSTGGSSSSRNTPPGNRSTNWQPQANGKAACQMCRRRGSLWTPLRAGSRAIANRGAKVALGVAIGWCWNARGATSATCRKPTRCERSGGSSRFSPAWSSSCSSSHTRNRSTSPNTSPCASRSRRSPGSHRRPGWRCCRKRASRTRSATCITAPSRGTLWWSRPRREKKPPGKPLDQRLAVCSRSSGRCSPDQSGWRSRASRCSTSCAFASRW